MRHQTSLLLLCRGVLSVDKNNITYVCFDVVISCYNKGTKCRDWLMSHAKWLIQVDVLYVGSLTPQLHWGTTFTTAKKVYCHSIVYSIVINVHCEKGGS